MRVDLFDFDLPDALIALRPSQPREAARLLHVPKAGAGDAPFNDRHIADLPQLLKAGDAVVVNVTKVIPARLVGRRLRAGEIDTGANGAKVEVTLTERLGPTEWQCFLKPAKRVAIGDRLIFENGQNRASADVTMREQGAACLSFELAPDAMEPVLATLGTMPLPPYIAARRAPDVQDNEDYQTVFAKTEGAVAAPTAGLHFTPELIDKLKGKGVSIFEVTLHVGPGTFLPVKVEDTDAHEMHGEWGQVTADTANALNAARAQGGRIVCIGTTAMRLLESAARPDGKIEPFETVTDIFITPGYRFHAVDLLLTNFHLPRSTLFMLVSAFAGLKKMQAAYAHAIDAGYRFYSYGDACLLELADGEKQGDAV
ncbi:MAG: tRNA preQ1(34) S-adenosylmethionine ribosyltransferase-isomerase QueA [Parvibaculales bacterium]